MGIPAGHKTASTRCTDRVLAECRRERNSVRFHQAIKVGGDCGWITHVAEDIATPLIGIENDDVRRLHFVVLMIVVNTMILQVVLDIPVNSVSRSHTTIPIFQGVIEKVATPTGNSSGQFCRVGVNVLNMRDKTISKIDYSENVLLRIG